ncbi:MAG: hypothetical protein LCH96_08940 [Actinobacteria bacterium]|nr:hypothetical protein [Actinomycetota bacterium]
MLRVALAAMLLLVAGCSADPEPTASATLVPMGEDRTIALGGGLRLDPGPDGSDTNWAPSPNDCTDRVHLITTPTGDYQVVLVNAGCTSQTVAGNGFHGYFVDPPEKAIVEQFTTPAGDLRLFANSYFECTNSCTTGTDQVGLLTLGPQVLQVIALASPSGTYQDRTRGELKAFLANLSRD